MWRDVDKVGGQSLFGDDGCVVECRVMSCGGWWVKNVCSLSK